MMDDSDVETTESEILDLLNWHTVLNQKSHESDTSSECDSDSELPANFAARTRVDNTAHVYQVSKLLSPDRTRVLLL